jgi:multidrug efflux pump subunit AcrA (membrane-fusion protein)
MGAKMTWIKKHKILFSIAMIFVLFAIGFVVFNSKKQTTPLTHSICKGSILECAYGIGTVNANKSYQLKNGVTGKIKNLFVKEGDFVEKGDKLVELETIFTAPFSGTVTSIFCHEGETIFSASDILELTDLLDRYVVTMLDQNSVLRIRKGQMVKLSCDALRDQVFEGTVAAIYPSNNKFHVRIDIPNFPAQILPGMTVDVAIEIKKHSDVLLIPVTAIDKDKVMVKRNDQLQPMTVKIGVSDGMMAEVISSDLKEGDELFLPTLAGSK